MNILANITRMWLTRSIKPFVFKNEYDSFLEYMDQDKLGLYVHIPFCRSICTFCPYCKELYSEEKCEKYISALLKEIDTVGRRYKNKKTVTSLYFGGGTPALAVKYLKPVIDRLNKYFDITQGIGIELHPDDVTDETLTVLKNSGITKISIGIQSFSKKYIKLLGRKAPDAEKLKKTLSGNNFETISADLIFALPSQTYSDLKEDVETAFKIGANHIAIYPFIDFTFANSGIKPMKKTEKRQLLDMITVYLNNKGCKRESIWTFSYKPNSGYSSMTRENFLGFGCSATTLLNSQFKINTFNVNEYKKRIDEGQLPTSLTLRFTRRQRMIYYLFWTAYSTKVKSKDFEKFFGTPLKKEFGFELWLMKKCGFITERNGIYEMTLKGAFYYHHYENYYTLAYIDKMWGIMRKCSFPDKMIL